MTSAKKALCAAVAAALGTALAAQAGAARLPACVAWSDKAGDAVTGALMPLGQPYDAKVDITKVVVRSDGKRLTVEASVPGYAQRPTFGNGNGYELQFVLAGKTVVVYYLDSATRSQEALLNDQAGVRVNGTQVAGTAAQVTEKVGGGKVAVTIALAHLGKAVGTKIGPTTTVTDALARSSVTYGPAFTSTYDVALAPTGTKVRLGACR